MINASSQEFLNYHGMSPGRINIASMSKNMLAEMELGLSGKPSSIPMIPTYISPCGEIPLNVPVVVIDAGGTNYRCGLIEYTHDGWRKNSVNSFKMPGTIDSVTWGEFIATVADSISGMISQSDHIAFCFSYNFDATEDLDGRVNRIDKEVAILGAEGRMVAKSLRNELASRGITNKNIIVLNDTVAALIGTTCSLSLLDYDSFIGLVCGTGSNSCCAVPYRRIKKLGREDNAMTLINTESGLFCGVPMGDFDKLLDSESQIAGEQIMEKMIAGAYLGELARLMLITAAEENFLSEGAKLKANSISSFDASLVSAWASGNDLGIIGVNDNDYHFIKDISEALLLRSAKCVSALIIALMLLTETGRDERHPVAVCAEGSLIEKSYYFRDKLDVLLASAKNEYGLYAKIIVGKNATQFGAAATILANSREDVL